MNFGYQFYPTPPHVIQRMLEDENLQGVNVLEPHGGAGHLITAISLRGANVFACEIDEDLRQIIANKAELIGKDFLELKPEQVSHIQYCIMNPPFSQAEKHLLHAYDILPEGARIIALVNAETMRNTRYKDRERLEQIVDAYGGWEDIGSPFEDSLRTTKVNVALVKFSKPGEFAKSSEFSGFFMEDESEIQENGMIQYNKLRALVNRFTAAVKLFDEQINVGLQMNSLLGSFFKAELAFQVQVGNEIQTRGQFKKQLTKSAWKSAFGILDMDRFLTQKAKELVNKFVEENSGIPFTMRNVHRMMEIIVGTNQQRMLDSVKSIVDDVTYRAEENKYSLESWKTNNPDQYTHLLNRKFILPYYCSAEGSRVKLDYSGRDKIEEMTKVFSWCLGLNYKDVPSLHMYLSYDYVRKNSSGHYSDYATQYQLSHMGSDDVASNYEKLPCPGPGEWFDWWIFRIRGYKKGTFHFEFKDEEQWMLINQKYAQACGNPLPQKQKEQAKAKAQKQKQRETSVYSPENFKVVAKATIKI